MKYAVLAGLLLASASAADNQPETAQKYVQIVEGFLMGTLDAEGFTDIEKCIGDGSTIIKDAEDAYNHLSKSDLSDKIKGVEDIADAVKAIASAMQDCSSIKADWEKLIKMAAIFKSPVSFAWHVGGDIIHNGVKITEEVETAISDYKSENWYDFGKQCGEAAAHVFLGSASQAELKKMRLAQMYSGFLKAFGGDFNVLNLLLCIYDEDQALLFLDVAYQALQQALHDATVEDAIGDVLGAVIGVVGAYQQFEQGLPVCEAIFSSKFDFTPVERSMKFVSNPLENMGQMTANLAKYRGEIMDDVTSAVFHYQMEDYEKFGEFLGNLIKAVSEQDAAPKKTTWADVYPKDNRMMVAEVAQGFMEATKVGEFNFTNLLLCVYEADQAAIALYESVELLEEAWEKKDWQEAIGGVIGVAAFVQGMQQALPICESVDHKSYNWTEANKLIALTQNKEKTVKIVGENLLFNGVTITSDFVQAMEAFEAGNYKQFGSVLGNTLMLATETQEKNLFLY